MPDPISIAPAEPEVNEELVRFLEHLLVEAMAGRVLSLACAGEKTGREVFSMFSGDFDVFRMLGALELLKSRIVARHVEPG